MTVKKTTKRRPKRRPKRQLKEGTISLISLVPRGANQVRSLFKDHDAVEACAVAKMGAEGMLTTLVYVPDDTDSQGDFAKAEHIRQWAHDFIPNMDGSGIDVLHDCQPLDAEQAHVCETFIVQKGDPRFEGITDDQGTAIDPTGAWGVIIKIDDPELRKLYETGEWVGVSMFGSAIAEPVSTTKSADPEPEEDPMTPEQMAEMAKMVAEAVAKATAPAEPEPAPEAPAIEFEGDIHDPEAVAKHADRVLFASLDMSKPADVAKWQAHLTKQAEARKQAEAANPNADEIAKLQEQIRKLQGAPVDGSEPVTTPGTVSKADLFARGKERAERLKKAGVIR